MEEKERHLTSKIIRRVEHRITQHIIILVTGRGCIYFRRDVVILTRVDEVRKGSSGLIRREFVKPDLTLNQDPHLERAAFIGLDLLHEPTLVVHATIGSLHWSGGNWDRQTPLRES